MGEDGAGDAVLCWFTHHRGEEVSERARGEQEEQGRGSRRAQGRERKEKAARRGKGARGEGSDAPFTCSP